MDGQLDGYAKVPPELPEVRILRLRPDDVLVFTTPGRLSYDEFEHISASLKGAFGDYPGVRVAVLEGGMTVDILRLETPEGSDG